MFNVRNISLNNRFQVNRTNHFVILLHIKKGRKENIEFLLPALIRVEIIEDK